MKRFTTVTVLIAALVASAAAQQAQSGGGGTGQGQAQQATTVTTPHPGQAQGRGTPPPPGQGRGQRATTTTQSGQGQGEGQGRGMGLTRGQNNIRLDITINDQGTGGQAIRKTISLLMADGEAGRVRSTGTLTQQFVGPGMVTPDGKPIVSVRAVGEVQLNVDAHVALLAEDRIRTRITLEYTPGAPALPLPPEGAVVQHPLNQSVTVILQHGKPLIITQAADPLSDRKITVEVTATILR
jgi:hypothetical protein